MKWYEIARLIIFILRLLDLLPEEKKAQARTEALDAVAKVLEEDNLA